MKNKQLYKNALALAVPMMIQNGVTNAVGLVDNIMVGSLGTETMTAVSIIGQLMFVFNLSIFGGLSGPGIYGAQYYGQGNEEGFRQTFRLKHWICGVCLLLGTLIFAFGQDMLIGLYLRGESNSVDPALTLATAKEYLHIMMFGMLPFVVTQIYAGSLRETGESIKPMAAGIISVLVDIVFNYLLIFGKFGMPCLGVKGAALATVIARVCEMSIVIIWANARKDKHTFLKNIYSTILVPKDTSLGIIKKGLPIFFNEFMWSGGIAALTQAYSTLGLDIIAGMNISNALCNMMNVVFIALGNAVGILIGQTLGASEYERAKRDSYSLTVFTGVICVFLAAVLIALSGSFPKLYDTSEEIRQSGQMFIVITAIFFPVQGILNSLYFTLRSGGKTLITFLFDSVFTWTITLPAALLLCNFSSLHVYAIFAIVQSVDIVKVIVGFILIKKGVWLSNIVEQKQ
ncbi:MAG: MATE family efflux transporter [Huintestinicola sp.]